MTNKISELIVDNTKILTLYSVPRGFSIDTEEAEQQLKQYFKEEMLKLVGEDEPRIDDGSMRPSQYLDNKRRGRNQFRSKLRQAIDKWEG